MLGRLFGVPIWGRFIDVPIWGRLLGVPIWGRHYLRNSFAFSVPIWGGHYLRSSFAFSVPIWYDFLLASSLLGSVTYSDLKLNVSTSISTRFAEAGISNAEVYMGSEGWTSGSNDEVSVFSC